MRQLDGVVKLDVDGVTNGAPAQFDNGVAAELKCCYSQRPDSEGTERGDGGQHR